MILKGARLLAITESIAQGLIFPVQISMLCFLELYLLCFTRSVHINCILPDVVYSYSKDHALSFPAKYCSADTMPGGKGASVTDFSPRYFLSCLNGKMFSSGTISSYGVGSYGISDCVKGIWTPSEIPSCVGKPSCARTHFYPVV